MSFQYDLEPKEEAVADFVSEVGKKLQRAVNARNLQGRLTQNDIAEKLGVDRSRVNRCLSGFNNLTLKTIAELVWAIDGRIDFSIDLNQTVDVSNVVMLPNRTGNTFSLDTSSHEQAPSHDVRVLEQARC